ncbi:MAG: PilN domain-containing protein [Phycisphaerales bacterium]|nr:PilN domain-containing protein [Phycisphaerales bacterium]
MNTSPRTDTSNDHVLVLHQRGSSWSGLLVSVQPERGIKVVETASFSASGDEIQAWMDARSISSARVILPASNVICRTCSLPESDESHLESALQLQMETQLLGAAPSHRIGGAILPAAAHVSVRTGLILAWPESSVFNGPPLKTTPLFIPDVTAIAALMNGLHPPDPIVWCDRTDGSIGLVLAQQERVLVRATQEELDSAGATAQSIHTLLLESALQTGSASDTARELADRTTQGLGSDAADHMLLLPAPVISDMRERIHGVDVDEQWCKTWGVAAGAALAMSNDLVLLTTFRQQLPQENPSLIESTTSRLKTTEVAAWLALTAVLVLAFGPLIVHGLRLGLLKVLHPGIEAQVSDYESGRNRQTMYSAMLAETWPMSKLLADIANNTPEGIELESVKLGHGEPVKIRGIAKPNGDQDAAALATKMKAQLQGSGVFNDVTLRWENSETYGDREFDITAKVERPHFRPAYITEQDFGAWTLVSRRSGEGPGGDTSEADSSTATAAAETTPSSDTTESNPTSLTSRTGSGDETTLSGSSSSRPSRPSSNRDTTRPNRGTNSGVASRGNSDDQGADLTSIPTGRIPEPLTEEQIQTLTLSEARIKLKEVADARKHVRDEEVSERLRNEFKMIMAHMRELQKSGDTQ